MKPKKVVIDYVKSCNSVVFSVFLRFIDQSIYLDFLDMQGNSLHFIRGIKSSCVCRFEFDTKTIKVFKLL